ncbi:MAG: pyrophosphohydrolase [Cellvibrionaceae bacterium]|nr:pyrophosphohydrolase [Cellvibrionaceae bacterium]|tara:strand:+ start:45449 stop:46381 length:933 start_codon:yes stop_codon:yes gene_type:complete
MTKIIHVAAGVISNTRGEILIAKRDQNAHQGGLWEFPGGKLESGETVDVALVRELQEELGITATQLSPLIQIRHDYSDKSVLLDVWRVTDFDGEAHGKEGQPVRWVSPVELNQYNFPAANVPIVAAAQLPSVLVISDAEQSVESFLETLKHCLTEGVNLIQLRQHQWSPDQWHRAVAEAWPLCRNAGALLMLNSPKGDARADGVHLTAQQLMASDQPLQKQAGQWLSASCHNAKEIQQAQDRGVDFVTLSPVLPTQSHPGRPVLGWAEFSQLAARAKIPVYALGGLTDEDLKPAIAAGAQGVAGIRSWWQ